MPHEQVQSQFLVVVDKKLAACSKCLDRFSRRFHTEVAPQSAHIQEDKLDMQWKSMQWLDTICTFL